MKYDRDPQFLHPLLRARLEAIIAAISAKLPAGHSAKMISAHRTPQDQFELYEKGRVFKNGSWVKVGSVVTNIDGLTRLSMHNHLPALAIDIGIFDAAGAYLGESPSYKHVKLGAVAAGMDWGGDWTGFVDRPHIEMPKSLALKGNPIRESALQWQRYLTKDGTYTGAPDGLFGKKSVEALEASTGSSIRDLATWTKLVKKHGRLE